MKKFIAGLVLGAALSTTAPAQAGYYSVYHVAKALFQMNNNIASVKKAQVGAGVLAEESSVGSRSSLRG